MGQMMYRPWKSRGKPTSSSAFGLGFTKDVRLSNAEIEKAIQEIEAAKNPRIMIRLEEAIAAGKK